MSAALTPRAIARMESSVHEVVERFAAPLRARGDVVDLLNEFTAPVSTIAMGRILGVPPKGDDEVRFRLLARRATRGIRPFLSDENRRKAETSAVEMVEYVLGLIEARRKEPGDDMISSLLSASATVPAGSDDIARVVSALVSAGAGTTGVACARALRSLLLHPSQLSLLRHEPSLLNNAVDELLRYDSGIILMPRYALEDLEIRGRKVRKGQLVAAGILSANRDPRVFPDPDRLDLRRDTREALAFGAGHHYCPGANLARIELRSMIGAALGFLPLHARVVEDRVRWSGSKGVLAQLKSLPVSFAAR